VKAIKAQDFKVQSALEERKIRVSGKKKDDLQTVIAFCRSKDFGVGLAFGNFRD
jgi:cyclic-di-GMP-binding protein